MMEQFSPANREILLLFVNIIEAATQVVGGVVYEIGVHRANDLIISIEQRACGRTPEKVSGEIRESGTQPIGIYLADRKPKVIRQRLRHKTLGGGHSDLVDCVLD